MAGDAHCRGSRFVKKSVQLAVQMLMRIRTHD
jgi:hypothetical protein